jgi:hypothetical protein
MKTARTGSVFQTITAALIDLSVKAFGLLGESRQFIEWTAEVMEKRLARMHSRMLDLALGYLLAWSGAMFLLLGIFFLITDYTPIPRGIVLTAGGLFTILGSVVFVHLRKNKGANE